jgi:hypothetical protein
LAGCNFLKNLAGLGDGFRGCHVVGVSIG